MEEVHNEKHCHAYNTVLNPTDVFWIPITSSYFWKIVETDMGFPSGSVVKNLPADVGDAGDLGSIPGLRRSPGEGNGNPLQYACQEIPWTAKSGGLQSLGSQRVGHDWAIQQQHVEIYTAMDNTGKPTTKAFSSSGIHIPETRKHWPVSLLTLSWEQAGWRHLVKGALVPSGFRTLYGKEC